MPERDLWESPVPGDGCAGKAVRGNPPAATLAERPGPPLQRPRRRWAANRILAACKPHIDYNLVIGWACTSQYMHVSGQPLQAKDNDLYELAQSARAQEADLRTVAQLLESRRSE